MKKNIYDYLSSRSSSKKKDSKQLKKLVNRHLKDASAGKSPEPPKKEKNLKAFTYPSYTIGLSVKPDVYTKIMEGLVDSDLDVATKKDYLGHIMKILKAKSGKILRAEDTDGYAAAMEMQLNTGYVFIDHDHPNMMTSFDSEDYWRSSDDDERHYGDDEGDDDEGFEEDDDQRTFEKTSFKNGISAAIDWMEDCEWQEPKGRE
jgi:hypothetical protein